VALNTRDLVYLGVHGVVGMRVEELNACIGGATAPSLLLDTNRASSLVYRAADISVSGATFSGLYRSAGSTVGDGQVVQNDVLTGSGVDVIDPVVARYLIGSGELVG